MQRCPSRHPRQVVAKLLEWGGELHYADFYETLMLNGVLGTQRGMESGAMLYTMPLGHGVSKLDAQAWRTSKHGGWSTPFGDWWCCSGTGLEGFAQLQRGLFLHTTEEDPQQQARLVCRLHVTSRNRSSSEGIHVTGAVHVRYRRHFVLRVRLVLILPAHECHICSRSSWSPSLSRVG